MRRELGCIRMLLGFLALRVLIEVDIYFARLHLHILSRSNVDLYQYSPPTQFSEYGNSVHAPGKYDIGDYVSVVMSCFGKLRTPVEPTLKVVTRQVAYPRRTYTQGRDSASCVPPSNYTQGRDSASCVPPSNLQSCRDSATCVPPSNLRHVLAI
jgi:hypothetical protein